jgi:hypothetical protein
LRQPLRQESGVEREKQNEADHNGTMLLPIKRSVDFDFAEIFDIDSKYFEI